MKKGGPNSGIVTGLSLAQLGSLEAELGVFIREPEDRSRMLEQQFGIYDEDGLFTGDICADGMFFTMDELRKKILALFPGN